MKDALAKRLVTLSKISIVLSLVCFVYFINRLDAEDFRKDWQAMSVVESTVVGENINSIAEERETHDAMKTWLLKNDPRVSALNQRHHRLLQEFLVDSARVVAREGGTHSRFSLLELSIDTSRAMTTVENDEESDINDPIMASGMSRELETFRFLCDNQTIRAVDSLDWTPLRAARKRLSDSAQSSQYGLRYESVRLRGDSVVIEIQENIPGMYQRVAESEFIAMPAYAQTFQIPFMLETLGLGMEESEALCRDQVQLGRIGTVYGRLTIDQAKTLAAEEIARTYQSAQIVGIDFSRRRFSLAILLLNVLITASIYATVRRAAMNSLPVIRSVDDEDIVDGVLNSPVLRAVVWVVLPILSVLLSRSPFPLEWYEMVIIGIGILTLLVLSSRAVWLSRNL